MILIVRIGVLAQRYFYLFTRFIVLKHNGIFVIEMSHYKSHSSLRKSKLFSKASGENYRALLVSSVCFEDRGPEVVILLRSNQNSGGRWAEVKLFDWVVQILEYVAIG